MKICNLLLLVGLGAAQLLQGVNLLTLLTGFDPQQKMKQDQEKWKVENAQKFQRDMANETHRWQMEFAKQQKEETRKMMDEMKSDTKDLSDRRQEIMEETSKMAAEAAKADAEAQSTKKVIEAKIKEQLANAQSESAEKQMAMEIKFHKKQQEADRFYVEQKLKIQQDLDDIRDSNLNEYKDLYKKEAHKYLSMIEKASKKHMKDIEDLLKKQAEQHSAYQNETLQLIKTLKNENMEAFQKLLEQGQKRMDAINKSIDEEVAKQTAAASKLAQEIRQFAKERQTQNAEFGKTLMDYSERQSKIDDEMNFKLVDMNTNAFDKLTDYNLKMAEVATQNMKNVASRPSQDDDYHSNDRRYRDEYSSQYDDYQDDDRRYHRQGDDRRYRDEYSSQYDDYRGDHHRYHRRGDDRRYRDEYSSQYDDDQSDDSRYRNEANKPQIDSEGRAFPDPSANALRSAPNSLKASRNPVAAPIDPDYPGRAFPDPSANALRSAPNSLKASRNPVAAPPPTAPSVTRTVESPPRGSVKTMNDLGWSEEESQRRYPRAISSAYQNMFPSLFAVVTVMLAF